MVNSDGSGDWQYFDPQTFRARSRCSYDDRGTMPARRYVSFFPLASLRNKIPSGLPAGVLNIVHGGIPTVNSICDHPAIRAISFVGGDKAGKHIYER